MRQLLLCTALIVASYAQPLSRLTSILPDDAHLRFPSSSVLLGTDARVLDDLARELPDEPGVVVARASGDAAMGPYMVVSTRLWPRPVTLVACGASSAEAPVTLFEGPSPRWRLDLTLSPTTIRTTPLRGVGALADLCDLTP